MDEMKIKTGFMRAFISNLIGKAIKKLGYDIPVSVESLEVLHDDDGKAEIDLHITGTLADSELKKILNGFGL